MLKKRLVQFLLAPAVVLLGAIIFCGSVLAQEESDSSATVEALRRTLRALPEDLLWGDPILAKRVQNASKPEERTKILNQAYERLLGLQVNALLSLPEMRRALELYDWRGDPNAPNSVHRRAQQQLTQHFLQAMRTAIKAESVPRRLAALTMFGATAASVGTPEHSKGLGRVFGPDLIELIKQDNDSRVRESAVRVLGTVFPEPDLAIPVLAISMKSKQVTERRAAADSLGSLVDVASGLSQHQGWGRTVKADRWDVVSAGRAVVPTSGLGLMDLDSEVRRASVDAIRKAAHALSLVRPTDSEQPRYSESGWPSEADVTEARKIYAELMPLTQALRDQVGKLSKTLSDTEIKVCLAANEALEATADARLRWLELTKGPDGKSAEDPLGPVLRDAAPNLAKELSHKEVRIRLAALYVLESMATESAPAIDALVAALQDSNSFVRWGAARTLAKLAPREADKAVPGLAKVVDDPNGDVRLSTLDALKRYGPAAKGAVPALSRAVNSGNADQRVRVINALGAIGREAEPSVPVLAAALSAPEADVRSAAAAALGQIGKVTPAAKEALLKALDDADAQVRVAASDALLVIE